jgi:Protein of unknown function (DUF416)
VIPAFDVGRLENELSKLPIGGRAAFAAACAERLLPGYGPYADSEGSRYQMQRLRSLLDIAWNCVDSRAEGCDASALTSLADEAVDMAPETIDDYSVERFFAQCAAGAVAEALWTAAGDPDVRCGSGPAQLTQDVVETIIHGPFRTGSDPALDLERVMSHPLVQVQLRRQERDLEELQAAGTALAEVAQTLRTRAVTESVYS